MSRERDRRHGFPRTGIDRDRIEGDSRRRFGHTPYLIFLEPAELPSVPCQHLGGVEKGQALVLLRREKIASQAHSSESGLHPLPARWRGGQSVPAWVVGVHVHQAERVQEFVRSHRSPRARLCGRPQNERVDAYGRRNVALVCGRESRRDAAAEMGAGHNDHHDVVPREVEFGVGESRCLLCYHGWGVCEQVVGVVVLSAQPPVQRLQDNVELAVADRLKVCLDVGESQFGLAVSRVRGRRVREVHE